ncbi:hypothetical protein BDK51DRAFT_18939 [Blyttiomyces helicus]|uniref:Tyrosinase copper-binding domain-containing protein n=1 Tax=Blyttiomyces helicus TaxID=388810 RepID=A0A4P9VZN9_9FUNG|nr:hypothetical protein BDK51DRAFT_18939 [Blyttiomyces helicus]|eukprot:RKO84812.1 hypothetical protein BDK51DRAFT_18939 [Blyttiomyces helicus]
MRPSVWTLFPLIFSLAAPPSLGVAATECKTYTHRREWRLMSEAQREDWISSIKCLMSFEYERLSFDNTGGRLSTMQSIYDEFAFAHDQLNDFVHMNAYFLSWRAFLHIFDTKLRDTCGYKGPTPYWDWSLDVQDLFSAPVFDPHPTHGLGTNGNCLTADCRVHDGAFGPSPLSEAPAPIFAHPIPHSLRRNLTLYFGEKPDEKPFNHSLSQTHIANVTQRSTGDFFKFQYSMTQIHNDVHNFVGGDLAGTCPDQYQLVQGVDCATGFTPYDPLFWLHHGNLDRLYSNWQNADPLNFNSFSGITLHPKNISDTRFTRNATAGHILLFDNLSAPKHVNEVGFPTRWFGERRLEGQGGGRKKGRVVT